LNQIDPNEERNKKFAQWSIIGAILLAITLVAVPAMKMRRNNRGQLVEVGRSLYVDHCSQCHGVEGIGQDPKQPRGAKLASGKYLAPALNEKGGAWFKSNRELFDYVKLGSLDAKSPMVGFEEKLTDQQIASTLVYVQSLWPESVMRQHTENSPFIPIKSEAPGY